MDNEVNFNDQPQTPAGESSASESGAANQPRPNGGGPKKFWKKRRKFRPPNGGQNQQGGAQSAGPNPNNGGGAQNRPRFQQNRRNNQRGGRQQRPGLSGPMDHAYREPNGNASGNGSSNSSNAMGGGGGARLQRNGRNNQRGGGGGRFGRNFQQQPQVPQKTNTFSYDSIQPVVSNGEDLGTRIYLFVDDLFFVTKINETARKLQIKVAFVKTMDELLAKVEEEGGQAPKLVIVDVGALTGKPITVIPKVKSKFKKETSILGFVPHVAGELKLKAQEAGCDSVMPRSAFSANLPNILRRYATDDLRDQEEC